MQEQFLPNGNLTPGIHTYTVLEFEQQFVTGFSSSTTRHSIYNDFKQWLDQLLNLLPPRYLWMDGSYLTTKLDPKDIDLVAIYYPEDIEYEQQADVLDKVIHIDSRSYHCDAYLCYSFEHWTPHQLAAFPNQHTILQTYWMGQFGFDRSRNPKGIVQLDQHELLSNKTGVVTP